MKYTERTKVATSVLFSQFTKYYLVETEDSTFFFFLSFLSIIASPWSTSGDDLAHPTTEERGSAHHQRPHYPAPPAAAAHRAKPRHVTLSGNRTGHCHFPLAAVRHADKRGHELSKITSNRSGRLENGPLPRVSFTF